MSKFDICDRVITIRDGEIRKGVVNKIFDFTPVTIVKFDDGNIEKVDVSRLALEPKTEVKPDNEYRDINKLFEKSEINITPSEFIKIAARVTAKESDGNYHKGFMLSVYASQLARALFGDKE